MPSRLVVHCLGRRRLEGVIVLWQYLTRCFHVTMMDDGYVVLCLGEDNDGLKYEVITG